MSSNDRARFFSTYDILTASFFTRHVTRMGFNDQEIVALSGAHTIGRAFKERSGTTPHGKHLKYWHLGAVASCLSRGATLEVPVLHRTWLQGQKVLQVIHAPVYGTAGMLCCLHAYAPQCRCIVVNSANAVLQRCYDFRLITSQNHSLDCNPPLW